MFSKLHLWLSVPVGIFIAVICLTGACLVFEDEITGRLNRDIYTVAYEEGQKRMAPSEIISAVRRQMPDSLQVQGLQVQGREGLSYAVSFKNMGRKQLFVDPYTGEVKGWERNHAFFSTMRKLHRWLLDAPAKKGDKTVGKMVVGISTLVMVVILLTGLAVWWPKNRKNLRQRLSVKTGKGKFRFWYDTHVSLGFYATIFLLVMALTGLTWSFGWYRTTFYSAFGVEQSSGGQQANGHGVNGGERQKKRQEFDFTVWDKALAGIEMRYDGYESVAFSASSAKVTPEHFGMRRQDNVEFNRKTGAIEKITPYLEQPMGNKMKGLVYSIHTGSWGGIVTKIIYFLACLIGTSLPLTGYYFWLKRRKKH